MRTISITCTFLLLLSLAQMPMGYYTFLRIVITIAAITFAFKEYNASINLWVLVFSIIAVIFNPVVPVYLYEKRLWMPIDGSCAVLFLVYAFKNHRR